MIKPSYFLLVNPFLIYILDKGRIKKRSCKNICIFITRILPCEDHNKISHYRNSGVIDSDNVIFLSYFAKMIYLPYMSILKTLEAPLGNISQLGCEGRSN